jgi:Yip1 domain
MIKALQLLFETAKGWDEIARRERGLIWVLFLSLLPAILVASLIEGAGLVQLGNNPVRFDFGGRHFVPVSPALALRYETSQAVMTLLIVFLLSSAFLLILRSFHCRTTFTQAFTVMSYSYGPLLLMQAVDGIPEIPTWICRIVGGLLAAKVFYLGLGRVARPDPSNALGLYFLGSLLILALAGLGHFVALQILDGNLFANWMVWSRGSG